LAAAYGKEVDELWADLEANAERNGIELPVRVKWQDDNGNNLSGDELVKSFREKFEAKDFTNIRSTALVDRQENPIYDPDKIL